MGTFNQDDFIVIAVRLVVPLLILRYPLVGGWTALVLDALDVALMDALGGDGWANYRPTDSPLYFYYLTLMAIVAVRWQNPYAKWPALALYAWRAIGVVLFWLIGQRFLFFIFPNLFENWFLFVLVIWRFFPRVQSVSYTHLTLPTKRIV